MFNFKATPDNGEPLLFGSDSRDVANWERTHKGATMGQLGAQDGANLSFTALYAIAFFAAKRQGLIGAVSAAEFERGHALELVDEEEEPQEAPVSPYPDEPEGVPLNVPG